MDEDGFARLQSRPLEDVGPHRENVSGNVAASTTDRPWIGRQWAAGVLPVLGAYRRLASTRTRRPRHAPAGDSSADGDDLVKPPQTHHRRRIGRGGYFAGALQVDRAGSRPPPPRGSAPRHRLALAAAPGNLHARRRRRCRGRRVHGRGEGGFCHGWSSNELLSMRHFPANQTRMFAAPASSAIVGRAGGISHQRISPRSRCW